MVSIIIPFYNAEKYMEQCINSLKSQVYTDYEAIFINDGSTDKSCEIFEKNKNDQMIVIDNLKKGVSSARNTGLKIAKGEYIAFLDIDDLYNRNYLDNMVKCIKKYGTDIVLCDYIEHYQNKDLIIKLPWENRILNKKMIVEELVPSMIGKNGKEDETIFIRSLVWRTFISKKFYDKYKFEFEENIEIAEDLLFLLDVYLSADSIYILSEDIYIYNRYIGTSLDRYVENCLNKQLYFHEKFIEILKKHNIYECNKSRYGVNRLKMYMSAMSNCVRNKNKKEIFLETFKIIEFFNKDIFIKDIDCKLELIDKINYIFFKLKLKFLLSEIYIFKEKNRRKKLFSK